MKLIAAQISSIPGSVHKNIAHHVAIIEHATNHQANGIFFPELSLTGYQPALAKKLAIQADDERLKVFQHLSDRSGIVIAVGAPLPVKQGIQIAMFVFQPGTKVLTYSKQYLHDDEFPFFSPGNGQQLIPCAGQILAPAICYESLQARHAQQASKAGATVYLTSVAKSSRGVATAYSHYPHIAREYGMAVIMANCVGPADDYIGAGGSGVWNHRGELVAQADETNEALVIYDSQTGQGHVIGL